MDYLSLLRKRVILLLLFNQRSVIPVCVNWQIRLHILVCKTLKLQCNANHVQNFTEIIFVIEFHALD